MFGTEAAHLRLLEPGVALARYLDAEEESSTASAQTGSADTGPRRDFFDLKAGSLPADCVWHGKDTMKLAPPNQPEQQGMFQFLTRLERYFRARGIRDLHHRREVLDHCIQRDEARAAVAALWPVPTPPTTWQDFRYRLLQHFCPPTWAQQILAQWRASLTQGPKTARDYLTSFTYWNTLVAHLIPNGPALPAQFAALLLRAGTNHLMEMELSRRTYAAYDQAATADAILSAGRTLPHAGADPDFATTKRTEMARDPSVAAALKFTEHVKAHLNRLQYAGALGDWLKDQQGVSREQFDARRRDRQCVCCGSADHILYTCPLYSADALTKPAADRAAAQARFDERRDARDRRDERDRRRTREQRIRDRAREDVLKRTRAGEERLRRQDLAGARVADATPAASQPTAHPARAARSVVPASEDSNSDFAYSSEFSEDGTDRDGVLDGQPSGNGL
jgi:hypothetical protein